MKLEDWRQEIDSIDSKLVKLIDQRARIAAKIGELKAETGLPIIDKGREREVILKANQNSSKLDASVARVYRSIIHESRLIQTRIANELVKRGSKIH